MKPRSLWKTVRQLIVFQLKLTADALRDLLLSPISMIAALLDFVFRLDEESSLFNRLMHYGVLSDEFINLFNQYYTHTESGNLDNLMNKAEKTLKDEYLTKDGGVAGQDK